MHLYARSCDAPNAALTGCVVRTGATFSQENIAPLTLLGTEGWVVFKEEHTALLAGAKPNGKLHS